ncbi:hypothetical protein JXZ92_01235 [Mycoplasma sp. CSL10137]|uniref:hypothetical protein n=1 Tax=Mycoplasma sp. CSL10137 TaxID=2813824 RepID=UPI00197B55B9|nr:hypothetical protein [Mycoplasma sp. CSL10137]MBN4083444.1 hypothetical protein [Mycoplasma sp. CSL10137]
MVNIENRFETVWEYKYYYKLIRKLLKDLDYKVEYQNMYSFDNNFEYRFKDLVFVITKLGDTWMFRSNDININNWFLENSTFLDLKMKNITNY